MYAGVVTLSVSDVLKYCRMEALGDSCSCLAALLWLHQTRMSSRLLHERAIGKTVVPSNYALSSQFDPAIARTISHHASRH